MAHENLETNERIEGNQRRRGQRKRNNEATCFRSATRSPKQLASATVAKADKGQGEKERRKREREVVVEKSVVRRLKGRADVRE